MIVKCFCLFFLLSLGSSSVIIPEELPSLLSVAYSNIPPIKKGTDSRVGFGFAFGNHADFQVMFELGPQTNTAQLNGQPFGSSASGGSAKRQAPAPPKLTKTREKLLASDPNSYLHAWASKMRQPQAQTELPSLEDSVVELVKNQRGEYEIRQPKPQHIPHKVMEDLKRLYGQKKEEAKKLTEKKRSDADLKKITEDLSNVDLD